VITSKVEHGGCYDHVAPSAAVSPEPPRPGQTFGFDRYGVRVPAVIVSPYVAPGTIFGKSSAVPFDHTAVIATVHKRFGISEALTPRDAQAPDLDSVLTLPRPINLGPLRLKALPYAPSPATAAVAQTKPLNSGQKALVELAANLPPAPGGNLQTHLANLKATGLQPAPPTALASVHDARDYVKREAGNYFQSH
jgi:phospholipase C